MLFSSSRGITPLVIFAAIKRVVSRDSRAGVTGAWQDFRGENEAIG